MVMKDNLLKNTQFDWLQSMDNGVMYEEFRSHNTIYFRTLNEDERHNYESIF